MTLENFVECVAAMRNAQRQYFKTRSSDWLEKSKELERNIDRQIADFRDPVRYVYRQTGYVGHGAASALIAMSDLAINLTPVECACIVHHMGAFGLDERQLKEYDAALDRWPHEIIATHTADILAARVDEGGKF